MDPIVIAAIIGGICTIFAAIGGALFGKSEFLDRILRKKDMPSFAGSKWESKWKEKVGNDENDYKEYFEFTKQKANRVFGIITSDQYPNMKWNIEGDYNDRFLRLFWTPSKDATNHFFLDYGCYFFERRGDGSFIGYAVGFDSETNEIEIREHTMKQISR